MNFLNFFFPTTKFVGTWNRLRLGPRKHQLLVMVLVLVGAGSWMAIADYLPDFTVNNMAAPKSTVSLRQGGRQRQRSRLIFISRTRARGPHRKRRRNDGISRVRRSSPVIRFVSYSPPRSPTKKRSPIGHKKHPPKKGPKSVPSYQPPSEQHIQAPQPTPVPVQRIIEEPVQNLTLCLVNPLSQPAQGVPLQVLLYPKVGAPQRLSNLATDNRGQVRLTKIHLPVLIELRVGTTQPGTGSSGEDDDDDTSAEWQFSNTDAGFLEVLRPQGTTVGSHLVRNEAASPGLASINLPRARRMGVCAPTRLRREVVYEATPQNIEVQRNVADLNVTAPPGSMVTSPVLQDAVQVPPSGQLPLRLQVSDLEDGAIPLRVAATLPAGEAESVVESYSTNPYELNTAICPPLQLVRLTQFQVAGGIGVFDERDKVATQFGSLAEKKRSRTDGQITDNGDGSQWWIYGARGVAFKMRPSPFDEDARKAPAIIERIRVFNSNGGSIGGIAVGSDRDALHSALGKPESVTQFTDNTGEVEFFLDGGLQVAVLNNRVQWFELSRPSTLLRTGTTAFVPRQPAKLFIEDFNGNPRTNLSSIFDLSRYLEQVHSVRLVDSRDQADLVLRARVTDFSEDKDQLTGLIPYRYNCTTRLAYSLTDGLDGRTLQEMREVSATAKADYSKQALEGTALALLLGKFGGKAGKVGAAAIAGGGIYELNRLMKNAVNRCPAISTRSAFNSMVADINRASDFSVRVTKINYLAGTLQINGGRTQGIAEGDEFQVLVADRALPYEESGLSANYFSAVVRGVGDNSAVCELRHVRHKVNKTSESFDSQPARDWVQRLPDPATGLVSARAWVNFPAIPVITDADLERSNQMAEAHEQELQQTRQQQDDQTTTRKSDPLGDLLGGIFNRRKK